MSNYVSKAVHPETGVHEWAYFMDDHFGHHKYGVKFLDGSVFPADEIHSIDTTEEAPPEVWEAFVPGWEKEPEFASDTNVTPTPQPVLPEEIANRLETLESFWRAHGGDQYHGQTVLDWHTSELTRLEAEKVKAVEAMDAELNIVHRCLTDLYNHDDNAVAERVKQCLNEIEALDPEQKQGEVERE